MGTPKHLLEAAGGLLYARICQILHEALPDTRIHHIFLARSSTSHDALCSGLLELPNNGGALQLKIIEDDASLGIGPQQVFWQHTSLIRQRHGWFLLATTRLFKLLPCANCWKTTSLPSRTSRM
jgi:hypothetical protein